jgi:hypothetical protein
MTMPLNAEVVVSMRIRAGVVSSDDACVRPVPCLFATRPPR